jgi:predicted glycoside hydrolase/deacetylase ChbG (UPF0249 family)
LVWLWPRSIGWPLESGWNRAGARRGLDVDTKASHYLQLLHELPAGLSEWAVHPGLGDLASRKIDKGWRVRHTDLEFLISPEARDAVRQEGIVIIDYGTIKEAWLRRLASG